MGSSSVSLGLSLGLSVDWTWCVNCLFVKMSRSVNAVMCQTMEALEKQMLDGQKLQGPPTAADVYQYLEQRAQDDG